MPEQGEADRLQPRGLSGAGKKAGQLWVQRAEEEKTTSETQKSDSRPDHSQLNAFENFYEKFRKVPLKYIDVFIGVCVAALVIVVLVGILKSKGIL